MRHLSIVDGELAFVDPEERGVVCTIGPNAELIILEIRTPDAGTWIACTASPQVVQQDSADLRDFILLINHMAFQTQCEISLMEKDMSYADDVLWAHFERDHITITDVSIFHVARVTEGESA